MNPGILVWNASILSDILTTVANPCPKEATHLKVFLYSRCTVYGRMKGVRVEPTSCVQILAYLLPRFVILWHLLF